MPQGGWSQETEKTGSGSNGGLEGVAAAGGVEDRDVAYMGIQIGPAFLHPHQDIQPDQY